MLAEFSKIESKIRDILRGGVKNETLFMTEPCLEAVRAGREGNYPVAAGIFASQRLTFFWSQ